MSPMHALWLEARHVRIRGDVTRSFGGRGCRSRCARPASATPTSRWSAGTTRSRACPGTSSSGSSSGRTTRPSGSARRVAGEINAVCGTCGACHGRTQERTASAGPCSGSSDATGRSRRSCRCRSRTCTRFPDHVSDEAAVFTEPLAAALHVLDHVRPKDRVLVVGDGKLGHLVALAIATADCDLRVATRVPRERPILAAKGIATVASDDVTEASADVVVECTGQSGGLAVARRAVRPAGHDRHEEHVPRRGGVRLHADGRGRGHDRRVALRAVRAGHPGAWPTDGSIRLP